MCKNLNFSPKLYRGVVCVKLFGIFINISNVVTIQKVRDLEYLNETKNSCLSVNNNHHLELLHLLLERRMDDTNHQHFYMFIFQKT